MSSKRISVLCDCGEEAFFVDANSPEGKLEVVCSSCGKAYRVVPCTCPDTVTPHRYTLLRVPVS